MPLTAFTAKEKQEHLAACDSAYDGSVSKYLASLAESKAAGIYLGEIPKPGTMKKWRETSRRHLIDIARGQQGGALMFFFSLVLCVPLAH
jgi:hypothetical protein